MQTILLSSCFHSAGRLVQSHSPRTLRYRFCVVLALAILALRVSPAAAQMSVEILTSGATSDAEGPHYQDVEDAIKKFTTRDYEGARKLLEEARKKTPKLAPAEIMMAQLYRASNQSGPGRAELEKAVRKYPQDPEAYLLIGEIGLQEGRTTEAGLVFAKASEVTNAFKENPKRLQNFKIRSFAGLASVDESLERWKEAKVHLEAWVKADQDSANPHQRLGRALFQLKEAKEAYTEFQTAAKADAKLPPVDVTMASLYWTAGDKTKAEQFLERAIKAGGKDLRSKLALTQLLLTMNRLGDAQKYADEAVKADPKSIEAKLAAGVLARMQGDYKTAEKLLDAVHQQSPANFLATNHLALVLVEGDDASKQRALEFAEMNARQNPKNAEAVATLGWVYFKNGKVKEAEQALNSLMSAGGVTADSAFYLASMLAEQGRTTEALKLLENILNGERLFAYRKQAQVLLTSLKSPKAEGAGKKGSGTKKGSDKAGATKATKAAE